MTTLSELQRTLRRKNMGQYLLLAGCCFFSVLLMTAYVTMMRAPTVLSVLPEGGDSRKQVMMIFVLAVVGCAAFTLYAAGLFFRYKSRETGIFLALGASRQTLWRALAKELAVLSIGSCAAGALLGTPLAWIIWQGFRALVVDTAEMALSLDPSAYLFALAFSVFVILMLFLLLRRFIRRADVIEIIQQSHRAEPVRAVPLWYGWGGVALVVVGALLGYLTPGVIIRNLQYYPPEGLTALLYAPVFIGLYMLLLHTVVNGWRRGQGRYRNLIPSSMMKFQGRQTVRNMLVIAVLLAAGYFAMFYTPIMGVGQSLNIEQRAVDYAFNYRADQSMPSRGEIEQKAADMGVTLTSYMEQPIATLGIDGMEYQETKNTLGISYTETYRELVSSSPFLSESAYRALTGSTRTVAPGEIVPIVNDDGDTGGIMSIDDTLVTNVLTGKTLPVTPAEPERNTMLMQHKILNDADFARISEGLTAEWRETVVFFNVKNVDATYDFAKSLFYDLVDRSTDAVALYDGYDPVVKARDEQAGGAYFLDPAHMAEFGFEPITLDKRDSSNFRLYWKYMPQFRVLDKVDLVKNMAVYFMLFIFICIVCLSAVIVIVFTRCITIAMQNAYIYHDLRHLGASRGFLLDTLRGQISRVFVAPCVVGTSIIYAFYTMIMYFNDGMLSKGEITGLLACAALIALFTALLYGVYRMTLRHARQLLKI